MLKKGRQCLADDGDGEINDGNPNPCKKVKREVDLPLPVDDVNDELLPLGLGKLESSEIPSPFLFYPVMKVMMSQMTIDDLKRSRGVCTLWDQQATKELQKLTSQMKVKWVSPVYKIQKFANSLQDSPNKNFLLHKMSAPLETFSRLDRRFYQNFEPKSLTIDCMDVTTQELIDVLANSSENIKELQIELWLDLEFNEGIRWPENLNFPELEKLTLDLEFEEYGGEVIYEIKHFNFIIKNVLKNAPKCKSLKVTKKPIDIKLCNFLISSGVIEKLNNLEIFQGIDPLDGDLVFAQDLLDMAQAGLKLSKFAISFSFDELSKEEILGHLNKLMEFLTTQSDTLENLNLNISMIFEDPLYYDRDEEFLYGKFDMPPLPKLKVLEIGNDNMNSYITYSKMDLPTILPNLQEISFNLKSDFYNLNKIFKGSLEGVKKVMVKHSRGNSYSNYTKYYHLEKYFPNVVEFVLDHRDKDKLKNYWNTQYEYIPWKKTLEKLTLHPPTLEKYLKLGSLSHLKGLRRLELINKSTDVITIPNTFVKHFDFKSLSKTAVKSLKIQNYLVHEHLIEEFRSQYTLDYLPLKDYTQMNI